MTEWHKYPDEKPAPGSHCVVLARQKQTGWEFYKVAFFSPHGGWGDRGIFDEFDSLDILRWFEIPEPPEGEE